MLAGEQKSHHLPGFGAPEEGRQRLDSYWRQVGLPRAASVAVLYEFTLLAASLIIILR